MQGFDINLGIEDLKTALTHIRSQPESTGKAATVGFGLGGNLAFLMAARSDADCNISYYGTGIEDVLDEAPQIKKPLLMHLAEKDRYVPLTAQEKILATLNKMPKVDAWVYPGVDHAFARIGSGTYDKGAAQQANYATADFLATHIAKHRT
jgi:carboxymethylenebutenolidase